MTVEFLQRQHDFILMSGVLVCTVLAALGNAFRFVQPRWPWQWLAGFGVFFALKSALDLLILNFPEILGLQGSSDTFMAAAFFCLLELGRQGLRTSGWWMPGWWGQIPLWILALGSIWLRWLTIEAAIDCFLGIPGAALTALTFWRMSSEARERPSRSLRLTSVIFVLFALGILFDPAVGQHLVPSLFTFPIEVLLVILLWVGATALLLHYQSNRVRPPHFNHGWLWFAPALLLLILLGGWRTTNWREENREKFMHEQLLQQGIQIAACIDPELVKDLKFSLADRTNAPFLRLREQMIAYGHAIHHRCLYSVQLQPNGELKFGPENLDVKDPMASPPGTVYQKPPAGLRNIFENATPMTVGPYQDEYGMFVSCFAPVIDPHSGKVLLVVGMDIMADQWHQKILNHRFVPILFTLGLALILIVGIALLEFRNRLPLGRHKSWERLETIWTALAGIALTIAFACLSNEIQDRERRDSFRQLAQTHVQIFRAAIADVNENLFTLAGILQTAPEVTHAEFDTIASPMTRRSTVLAYEWAPKVTAAEKDSYEARIRQKTDPGFFISALGANGLLVPSTGQDNYYPIEFVTPQSENKKVLGFDLSSEKSRWQTMQKASMTRLATATGGLRLIQSTNSASSILVFHPVFSTTNFYGGVRGFIIAAMDLSTTLHTSMARQTHGAADLAVELLDLSAPTPTTLVQYPPIQSTRSTWQSFDLMNENSSELLDIFPMFSFGRVWAVVVHSGPGLHASPLARLGFTTSLAGILLTGVMVFFVRFARQRQFWLEQQVNERTRALRASEQNLQIAIAATDLGTWDWNIVTGEASFDERWAQMLGYELSQIKPYFQSWNLFMHPEDKERVNSILQAHLEGKTTDCEAELRLQHKSGHWIWVLLKGRVTERDSEGYPLRARGIHLDITARKEVERRLREAKELAEASNRAKGEFLATMSHELRTPMNGVLGMTELLLQTSLTARQREFAEATAQSANALLHVIDDVLDFSKIEAGKLTIVQEEYTLRSVVDAVLEIASLRDPSKKLSLAAIVHRDVPHRLIGDPLRLRQVLLNLVGNGIKFTNRGEVAVRIRPVGRQGDKLLIRLEVSDTGIGLTNEQIEKLFQPFVQADTSASRRFSGTGLGLAISRRLVELMGGQIGVFSEPGRGSTFWCELPFGVPPQPVIAMSHPGLVFARVVVGAVQPSMRESLVEQLHSWGVACTLASTVEDFVMQVRAMVNNGETAPVVICDDELLALGGERLRLDLEPWRGKVHSVLLSSPALAVTREEQDFDWFGNVLLKPVKQSQLFDELVGAIEGESAPPGLPETDFFKRGVRGVERMSLGHLRVLLAEDHPMNRKLCQLMLEGLGVRPDIAVNGAEAVRHCREKEYDVILMDCNMPELDGYGATAEIRKLEANRTRKTRIVALTANAMMGERERCLEAGMNDYLTKPFTSRQLEETLRATPARQANNPGNQDMLLTPDRLEELCQDLDQTAVVEMATEFAAELPARMAELEQLLAELKWTELQRHAHSLKGVAASFGLELLAKNSLAVEDAAGKAESPSAQVAIEKLLTVIDPTIKSLQNWIHKKNQSPSSK